MSGSQNRVLSHHPRAGVGHHRFDAIAHGRGVAVDVALRAHGLGGAVGAISQSLECVIVQLATGFAQRGFRLVIPLAVDPYHRLKRLRFAVHSLIRVASAQDRRLLPGATGPPWLHWSRSDRSLYYRTKRQSRA